MSAQLKLINSLPLIYWEPEQDFMHTKVVGRDYYHYNLLTIRLNGFSIPSQKLGQKLCISVALYVSQTQNNT